VKEAQNVEAAKEELIKQILLKITNNSKKEKEKME